MEVLFDLDHEAKETCEKLGIEFKRAATCSSDPDSQSWSEYSLRSDVHPSQKKRRSENTLLIMMCALRIAA